jgi:hypothetical protein
MWFTTVRTTYQLVLIPISSLPTNTQPPVQWVPVFLPRRKATLGTVFTSSPCWALRLRKGWSYASTSPLCLHGILQGELHLYILPFVLYVNCAILHSVAVSAWCWSLWNQITGCSKLSCIMGCPSELLSVHLSVISSFRCIISGVEKGVYSFVVWKVRTMWLVWTSFKGSDSILLSYQFFRTGMNQLLLASDRIYISLPAKQ